MDLIVHVMDNWTVTILTAPRSSGAPEASSNTESSRDASKRGALKPALLADCHSLTNSGPRSDSEMAAISA